MEDFRIIYRILKFLRDSMDFEEFDSEGFTSERFGTNDNRFHALLIQLDKAGYIEGLHVTRYIRSGIQIQSPIDVRVTLKGLEYLNENSLMKQAASLARGIKDVLP